MQCFFFEGAKRWMLLPPNTPPPGVFPSQDKANVVQPLSLVEWYMNFYDAAASGAGENVSEVF